MNPTRCFLSLLLTRVSSLFCNCLNISYAPFSEKRTNKQMNKKQNKTNKTTTTTIKDFTLISIRVRSETLVREPDAKRGPLKVLILVRGTLKIPQTFKWKLSFHTFLWGWPIIFFGIKGEGWSFEVSGRGGVSETFSRFYFCMRPPNKCLWTFPKVIFLVWQNCFGHHF